MVGGGSEINWAPRRPIGTEGSGRPRPRPRPRPDPAKILSRASLKGRQRRAQLPSSRKCAQGGPTTQGELVGWAGPAPCVSGQAWRLPRPFETRPKPQERRRGLLTRAPKRLGARSRATSRVRGRGGPGDARTRCVRTPGSRPCVAAPVGGAGCPPRSWALSVYDSFREDLEERRFRRARCWGSPSSPGAGDLTGPRVETASLVSPALAWGANAGFHPSHLLRPPISFP